MKTTGMSAMHITLRYETLLNISVALVDIKNQSNDRNILDEFPICFAEDNALNKYAENWRLNASAAAIIWR